MDVWRPIRFKNTFSGGTGLDEKEKTLKTIGFLVFFF